MTPTKKELSRFKITLLFLPIIPCGILIYKHHIFAAELFAAICWVLLLLMLIPNIFGKNIDKYVYIFVHKILEIIGNLLAVIALVFTWFCTVFPTGLIAKIVKRDRLRLNPPKSNSFWIDVKEKEPSYENQY